MAFIRKILLAFLISQILNNVICEESDTTLGPTTSKIEEDELEQSESKDGKLDIIKRIKKVNPDGSYTIGYEADDGSFKIESRDVLGNIKGTYGFVDEEGKVKRVSYSSSNASEIFSKHEPLNQPELPIQSVVQRIPKNDKSFTTRKPSTHSTTTQSTPTTTSSSVIQSIVRRRGSSTTSKPNYNSVESIRSTSKPNSVVYSSASPRVLLQRPSLVSTTSTKTRISDNKSEGQITRPEVVVEKPTEHTILRNVPFKTFDDEKPVTEEASEVSNNILRRQLPQNIRDGSSFNPKQHVYNLQQSYGNNDDSDVYNNGATATSRPLFTTSRPGRIAPIISSSTASTITVQRPAPKYATTYQNNYLQEVETNTAEYSQPIREISTSTEASSTTTNVPVVQIPPNNAGTPEPLVAIRHPFQQGAILVPLSQLRGRIIPVDNMQEVQDARRQYTAQQYVGQQTTSAPNVEIERQNVRKLATPSLRPLPVQVDSNGFIREMPQNVPTPYPLPVPVTPEPEQVRQIPVAPLPIRYEGYEENEIDDDIENIQPPVSTRDFQKLLNMLIKRQRKLELASALMKAKHLSAYYQPQPQPQPVQYQKVYQTPQPYFVQRVVPQRVQYSPLPQESEQPQQRGSTRQYVAVNPQIIEERPRYSYQYQSEEGENIESQPRRAAESYERKQSAYVPNRRVARLLPSRTSRQNQALSVYRQDNTQSTENDEYLPIEVREMLLLRMLKLAINPALPLDEEDESQQVATVTAPQFKRVPMRNVEILGEEEEEEEMQRPKKIYGSRTKRYKEEDMEYME